MLRPEPPGQVGPVGTGALWVFPGKATVEAIVSLACQMWDFSEATQAGTCFAQKSVQPLHPSVYFCTLCQEG